MTKTVKVNKKEMLEEHKHLLSVLQDGSKKERLKEYLKQRREIKEYK